MKKFLSYRGNLCLLAAVFAPMFIGLSSASGLTVTWQALPFPTTSDWPGPTGQPATITSTGAILQGQPVRSVESFSGPLTIDLDVVLQARTTDDGVFTVYLISPGLPTDQDVTTGTWFQMIYRNYDNDGLSIGQGNGLATANVWGEVPFNVVAGITNHVTMTVAADGILGMDVNGQPYSLPAIQTDSLFQIQLGGWQPDDIWTVSNFTLVPVPEPSAAAFLGASLAGLVALRGRHKR